MLRRGSVLLFLYSIQTSLMSRLGGALGLCVGLGMVRVLPIRWAPRRDPADSASGNAGGKKLADATFTYRPLPSGIRSGISLFLFGVGRFSGRGGNILVEHFL